MQLYTHTHTHTGDFKKRKNKIIFNVGADKSVSLQENINKPMLNVITSRIQSLTLNNAITLITLIITIIVLLILAGVTISMVMGENGIITKAQKAVKQFEISQYEEELNTVITEMQTNKMIEQKTLDKETLIKGLPANIQEVQKTTDFEWDINQNKEQPEGKYKGYSFYIDTSFKAHVGERSKGITITCEVIPSGYTNRNVNAIVKLKSDEGIKKITFENGNVLEGKGKKEVTLEEYKNIETNRTYTYEVEDMLGNKETKTAQIVNIDKLPPKTAKIELSSTDEGLKVTVTAEDAEETEDYANSGIDKYEYYLGTELKQTSEENECILTEITEDTNEDIYVKVYDKAGNVKESNKMLNLNVSEISYLLIKRNTTNIIKISGIQNSNYEITEKTNNIELKDNKIIANEKANSSDSCKIKITGTYNGQNYTKILTALVEPENKTTVQNKDENQREAYAIQTEQDLVRIQEIVSLGIKTDINAKLMNDIELNKGKYSFNDDGKIIFNGNQKRYSTIGTKDIPYEGIFDGNGKTITGMYIEKDEIAVGIFGVIAQNSEVKKLNLKNLYLKGRTTGGVVGYNEGKIYRCTIKNATIEHENGWAWSGGIAGVNNGEIIECCVLDGHIYGIAASGICGQNGTADNRAGVNYNKNIGKIERCYTVGGYIGNGNENAAIASHNGTYGGTGYIIDCYSTSKINEPFLGGSIVEVQSYSGNGGYIYNSYYLNEECSNLNTVVSPSYYGTVENSYVNDKTVTAEKLNNGTGNAWINDTTGVNNGYPILRWQLEN